MDSGIYIAARGGIVQDKNLEVIVNNLAGSSVAGFKKDLPVFALPQTLYPPPAVEFLERRSGGSGDLFTDFSPGVLKSTGNPLDLALSGEGFFVIQTPDGQRYTRKGDFVRDENGELKTRDGYPVEGERGAISLKPGKIVIRQDGTIEVNNNLIDKLKLVAFPEPYSLQKTGAGLFALKDENINELPAEEVSVLQGHLEMSNVNIIQEMVSMITALRSYESQMKLVKGFEDVTAETIRLARNR